MPQRTQGLTMLPSVSEPMAKPTKPAAVALQLPALLPLEPSSGFHGLRVFPPNQVSSIASSPRLSLASSTAPAASKRFTTVASRSKIWSR